MAWTLDQAKTYLGISGGDTSQDVAIQRTMDIVLATVERFLSRKLMDAANEVIVFKQTTAGNLYLPRYPIHQVNSITMESGTTDPTDLLVFAESGRLWSATFFGQKSITVDYDAGYDADASDAGTLPQIPADLDHVLWEAFMYLWGTVDQTTGGPSTTPGDEGDVRAVTVFDAFRIEYQSGSQGTSDEQRMLWDWLAPWESVLSTYQSGFNGANVGVA